MRSIVLCDSWLLTVRFVVSFWGILTENLGSGFRVYDERSVAWSYHLAVLTFASAYSNYVSLGVGLRLLLRFVAPHAIDDLLMVVVWSGSQISLDSHVHEFLLGSSILLVHGVSL